jgi:hypothetical protein
MGLKLLRYHYWCPFNHESDGISSPRSNLSYFLGTSGRGAPRMHCNTKDGVNCRGWTRFPDPQVVSPSNPDLWRKRPNAVRTFTRDHRTWLSRMVTFPNEYSSIIVVHKKYWVLKKHGPIESVNHHRACNLMTFNKKVWNVIHELNGLIRSASTEWCCGVR